MNNHDPHLVPLEEIEGAAIFDDAALPEEPPGFFDPAGPPASSAPRKFTLESFEAIVFESREEWLVKRLIPRQGVGAFYGASQSFKSFVVSDLALHIALGWEWAARRVTQAPAIYIAAEGAAGLRKRKIGFERSHSNLPACVPFYLISAAPNLGTEQGDLAPLTAAIEAAGVSPALIVVDTLAQSLGAGDENGAGMIQFVANATALANKFRAFVLIIHHVGLGDDKRMRGHSSLIGGVDAQILCERKDGALSTSLTLQKLKDEASSIKLTAHLARVVIGQDEDGDDISTLIVDNIQDGAEGQTGKPSKAIAAKQRLLMDMIAEAIAEAGEPFRPFGTDGPHVSAVGDDPIRRRYYARIAETAAPDEDKGKLAERQRKAFNRSIAAALDSKTILACERDGKRLIWLP
jgi:hypothetical protein